MMWTEVMLDNDASTGNASQVEHSVCPGSRIASSDRWWVMAPSFDTIYSTEPMEARAAVSRVLINELEEDDFDDFDEEDFDDDFDDDFEDEEDDFDYGAQELEGDLDDEDEDDFEEDTK